MTHSEAIFARFEPGFGVDLTCWRLFIGLNRWLRQEVVVYNEASEFHNQVLRFWVRLSRRDLADLWTIIDRIGFAELNRQYSHETTSVTDCPTYWIGVRFADRVKEVEAYDLYHLAEAERQPAMIGFLELWEAIQRYAPYGKVPMEVGLAKPWWRFW
jgi:hypothetical protein